MITCHITPSAFYNCDFRPALTSDMPGATSFPLSRRRLGPLNLSHLPSLRLLPVQPWARTSGRLVVGMFHQRTFLVMSLLYGRLVLINDRFDSARERLLRGRLVGP